MFYTGKDPASYPLSGMKYVMSNPGLWRSICCVALFGIMVSVTVLILLFALALKPQAEAFGGYQWWSWLLAVLAVLFEALLLSGLVLVLVYSKAKKTIFVETMQLEGKWREEMKEPSVFNDLNCCKVSFILGLITLPLNLIPVAGTIAYAYINGPYLGWDYMDMYFEAIHMEGKQQRIEVMGENNSVCTPSIYTSENEYMRFGFPGVLLESIPIFGPAVFSLTNSCAAALWACDMELSGGPPSLMTGPSVASLARGEHQSDVHG